MMTRTFLTRRRLLTTGAGAALAPWVRVRALSAQSKRAAWSPDEGLRLAGPESGLQVLDPALVRDFREMAVLRQVFSGLLDFDRDLLAVPGLAADMAVSDDATAYTFTLRGDAAFHDGRPIRASDVHASFVRALNPATAGGDASALAAVSYLQGIFGAAEVLAGSATDLAGLEMDNDRRFTIRLATPDAAFPLKLASVPAAIVDAGQDAGTSIPNGTGPYAVSTFTPGEVLELRASDHWYGPAPTVSRVSFRLGSAASQPLNLFQAGEIDVVDGLPNDQMRLLADPASGAVIGNVIETPLFSVFYLALSTVTPPLDDINIRRALQQAFPTPALTAANAGNIRPARGLVPPGMLGVDWDATVPNVDLDAARAAITASRYRSAANVPPIALYGGQTSIADPMHNVGGVMRETVGRDLGLTIEPISVDWGDFLSGLPQRRFSSYSISWIADYPDPESMLWVLFGSDSSENYTGYSNPAFDDLLARARREPDVATRIARYREAQQILIDDAVLIPLYFDVGYSAVRPGIGDLPVSPIGMLRLDAVSGISATS
ncbi:MAG: peptide ABC transporter substrate-binding protein [Thermomicrobiales bacterium]